MSEFGRKGGVCGGWRERGVSCQQNRSLTLRYFQHLFYRKRTCFLLVQHVHSITQVGIVSLFVAFLEIVAFLTNYLSIIYLEEKLLPVY